MTSSLRAVLLLWMLVPAASLGTLFSLQFYGSFTLNWTLTGMNTSKPSVVFVMQIMGGGQYGSIGIGSAMNAADIMFASADAQGLSLSDCIGSGHNTPPTDVSRRGQMNLVPVSSSFINNVQLITFSRLLVTGDQYDLPITNTTQSVIWATGPGTALSPGQHPGGCYGNAQINFITGQGTVTGSTSYVLTIVMAVVIVILIVGTLIASWILSRRHPSFQWIFHTELIPFLDLTPGALIVIVFWVIGLALFTASEVSGQAPGYRALGSSAIYCFAFILFCVLRNSPFTYIMTIPFERSVRYHRYLGVLVFAFITAHGAGMISSYGSTAFSWTANKNNLAGVICWGLCLLMWVTAFDPIRRHLWEGFQISHMLLFPLVILFGAIHDIGVIIGISVGLVLYAIDLILRGRHIHSTKASVEAVFVSGDILQLQIRAPSFRYDPGQYIFLNCPTISMLQWHPFTVVPHVGDSDVFTLLVKDNGAGAFTNRMMAGTTALSIGQPLRVDGPYGKLSVPLGAHPTIILVAGGIGITPMLSILAQCQKGSSESGATPPSPRRVVLLLSVRDQQALDMFSPFFRPALKSTTVQLRTCIYVSAREKSLEVPRLIPTLSSIVGSNPPTRLHDESTQSEKLPPPPPPPPSTPNDSSSFTVVVPASTPNLPSQNERIDFFKEISAELAAAAVRQEKYLAVYCCGPASMVSSVQAAVRRVNSTCGGPVTVLFHKETFEL